jgi:MOSC domain-containing protein YiiM
MTAVASISLVSLNVALPSYLTELRGDLIESGIRKQPVSADTVTVSTTNIEGDGQGDLIAHGGPEKAVYAYPSEHWDPWTEELKPALPYGPGSFGENLSLAGILEDDACIGDIWRWGDVRLQICQPRYPCYKLAEVLHRPNVVRKMVENGRTGWYFRVLTPGTAPTSGPIEIESRHPAGVTVTMAHTARLPGAPRALIEQVASVDALASRLRHAFDDVLIG